jgi:PmbA protein
VSAAPHDEIATAAARAAVRRPRVAGADVWIKESRHRRLLWTPEGEQAAEAGEAGLAVRLFRPDGRVGHAFTGDAGDPAALAAATEAADRLADRCAPGASSLPPGAWSPPDLDLLDPAVEGLASPAALLATLREAVAEEGRGEVAVESLVCVAGASTVTMATSGGFLGSYRSSLVSLVLGLRASRGTASSFERSVVAARHLAALDPGRIGRDAARRARLALGEDGLPRGPVRVALEPRAACLLLEQMAPSLVAGAAGLGRSALPAEEGAAVGSAVLTVIDDPALPRGIASAPFDGEGRRTERRTLVAAGRLRALIGAGRDGARVGASHRASYADPPRRGPSNLHLAPGAREPGAILAGAGDVLRVRGAALLGRGGPASGEVALAAAGERLASGEPAGGVRGVTLVGALRDLLAGILEVGADLRFHLRGIAVGSPTVLLDGFSVV